MPEPALYLHRLEAGQLVRGVLGLELLIEPLQDVRGPAYDPRQDGRHLVVARSVQGLEPRRPDALVDEDRVRYQGGVEVDVQVERASEPLDGGHAADPRFGRLRSPRGPPLPGEDGAGEDGVSQTRLAKTRCNAAALYAFASVTARKTAAATGETR